MQIKINNYLYTTLLLHINNIITLHNANSLLDEIHLFMKDLLEKLKKINRIIITTLEQAEQKILQHAISATPQLSAKPQLSVKPLKPSHLKEQIQQLNVKIQKIEQKAIRMEQREEQKLYKQLLELESITYHINPLVVITPEQIDKLIKEYYHIFGDISTESHA